MLSLALNTVRKSKFGITSCLIDGEDFEKLNPHRWTAQKIGKNFYAIRKDKNNKTILLHRFLLGVDKGDYIVDHINGNTLDNRKSNLRICDKRLNALNTSHKGYYFSKKRKKFHVRIVIFKVDKFFETETEAAECVKIERKKAIDVYLALQNKRPYWLSSMEQTAHIGQQTFYKEKMRVKSHAKSRNGSHTTRNRSDLRVRT